MSTLAEIGTLKSRPASRSRVVRILLWLALAGLILLAGAVGYAYYVARSALPQLDGQLQVRGLAAPVTVTRDSHGVPTIEASTLEDLFFAQGYVTAQDRLWQMDVMRRFGSGELSEILGEALLKVDREQRISGSARGCSEVAADGRSSGSEFLRGVCARGERLYCCASSPVANRVSNSRLCTETVAGGRFAGHRQ